METKQLLEERQPKLSEVPIIRIIAFILTCSSVAWALDLFSRLFGLLIYQEQFLAFVYALVLLMAFLILPVIRYQSKTTIPWYDYLLGITGFISAMYVAWRYPILSELIAQRPFDGMITAILLVPITLEALRRSAGGILTTIILIFIVYALFAHLVPGTFEGFYNAWDRLIYYFIWDSGSLLGSPILIAITIVVPYVLFGQILFRAGGADFFSDISVALMGRYRGGSAKISVVSSALFGTISGSAVSNVVTTGIITIPMMRSNGYPRHMAAAIEAVASTGGQLMPPLMGASAFLMAEFLSIPYSTVITAALIPAVLYFVALIIIADLEAARSGIVRVKEEDIPKPIAILKKGWHYPFSIFVLIFALFKFNLRAEEAVIWALVTLISTSMLIGYGDIRIKWHDITESVVRTGIIVIEIIIITAAVGFIIAVINITGLGSALTEILIQVAGGNKIALLIMAALCSIVLGLGMPTVAVYGLLAILVTPALVDVGISPIAAHLFVIYFGMMSMITPPVAVAAFAAASIAEADNLKTGIAAVKFGWVAYFVPFMFVFEENILMKGDGLDITLVFLTALVGVWMVSAAMAGYLIARLKTIDRVLVAGAGSVLLYGIFTHSYTVNITGLLLSITLVAFIWHRDRQHA